MKNGENTQFSSNNQPSPNAKKKGWERKRVAREFMDKVFEYQHLTIQEFENMFQKIDKNKHTMRDLMAMNYVCKLAKSDKLIVDWLNRHVEKTSPIKNNDSEEFPYDGVKVTIVNKHRTFDEIKEMRRQEKVN